MAKEENVIHVNICQKPIKNIYMRVQRDGTVLVTAPLSCSKKQIDEFIQKKKPWMIEHINQLAEVPTYHYQSGEKHYCLGETVTLNLYLINKWVKDRHNCGYVKENTVELYMCSMRTDPKKLYEDVMKSFLYEGLEYMVSMWAEKMGVQPGHITIRKMKSRWGSCNVRTGDLCFALDLVTKPRACIEEVVVHELNHLLEKGHTARFHELMAHWIPDYKERNKALNQWPKEFV